MQSESKETDEEWKRLRRELEQKDENAKPMRLELEEKLAKSESLREEAERQRNEAEGQRNEGERTQKEADEKLAETERIWKDLLDAALMQYSSYQDLFEHFLGSVPTTNFSDTNLDLNLATVTNEEMDTVWKLVQEFVLGNTGESEKADVEPYLREVLLRWPGKLLEIVRAAA
ncbi:hypothetical protein HK098_007843 [Nowakowskiella sp. JEL0407]|nr:hypothetical protein HK098_007843 [Nowakowskiella sp. JEL0407]